ncbi:MAG TPA: hypothetical protein VKV15_06880 [Bryobacteraceae bacterium]|nr:hypothetical protein [Bryobacteraceae bacterium]
MQPRSKYMIRVNHALLLAIIAVSTTVTSIYAQPPQAATVLARGGGKTIIQGGTGLAGGFVPVITTIAFHAERQGQAISGDFECLALAPAVSTGNGSGQFTVNAMYVTGQVTSAEVNGEIATLKGTATITGLGAGTNVPFTFVVRKGGPGSTSVLTASGLAFNEILLEGSFEVGGNN